MKIKLLEQGRDRKNKLRYYSLFKTSLVSIDILIN